MLTLGVVDIIPLIFCLVGIVIPQLYNSTKYKAAMIVVCMFVVSFVGAWIMLASFNQPFSMMFSRLFSLIGISHVVFSTAQSSMYWRIVLERVGFYKKEEEQKS
jgi:membrane protease YdiL (CAAX protease family)